MITMPFGKHRGKPIIELSSDYLAWLNDLPDLREPLASAIEAEVHRRRELPMADGEDCKVAESATLQSDDEPEDDVPPSNPTVPEVWRLDLKAEGSGPRAEIRVRRALKWLLRNFGLRCLSVSEAK